ncbi:MAG: holo-ACP synthase [Candidatus Zixiibacteriota bacterium]|nr:MAG: holo-ACP synthase [candidate division Zixibacteria bacterium]
MLKSIGLDLVEVDRIRADLDKYGERFAHRVLGADEQRIFDRRRDRPLFLAGRFAAKEAVIKALGHYLADRPPLSHLQILNDDTGQPVLRLPQYLKDKMSGVRCMISITHDRNYAASVAVFVEEK